MSFRPGNDLDTSLCFSKIIMTNPWRNILLEEHIVGKILGLIPFQENSIYGQIDHKEEDSVVACLELHKILFLIS